MKHSLKDKGTFAPSLPQGWTNEKVKQYFEVIGRIEQICKEQAQKRQIK